jgi:hypothetical protein
MGFVKTKKISKSKPKDGLKGMRNGYYIGERILGIREVKGY